MPEKEIDEDESEIIFFPVWNQLAPETDPEIIAEYKSKHKRLVKEGVITPDGKLSDKWSINKE